MLSRADWFTSPIFVTEWEDHSKHSGKFEKKITAMMKTMRSQNRSSVNGWQSVRNLQEHDFINPLMDFIPISIFQTMVEMNVDLSKCRLKIDKVWANVNRPGSYNKSHQHNDSFLSGVYYLKVPENSGSIYFEDPRNLWCLLQASYTENNSFSRMEVEYEPKEGMVILFPSYLSHRVDINNSNKDRISISFNVSFVE